jgi:hypothetical protein
MQVYIVQQRQFLEDFLDYGFFREYVYMTPTYNDTTDDS